ncbi:hypothetical protein RJ55_07844 [Drechmeria coniospora]|nr:hypothetical protein RJ55_07844 [Drechmeria coniospora]
MAVFKFISIQGSCSLSCPVGGSTVGAAGRPGTGESQGYHWLAKTHGQQVYPISHGELDNEYECRAVCASVKSSSCAANVAEADNMVKPQQVTMIRDEGW